MSGSVSTDASVSLRGRGAAIAPFQPRLVARFRSFPAMACLFVGVVSGLVLAGWMFNVEGLKTILYPNPVAMNPLTATSFLLCAVSLWLKPKEEPFVRDRAWRISLVCAAAVVLFATIVLMWQMGGWDTHIDEWMFRSQLAVRPMHNRMAPNTALNFLLVGSALLLLDVETSGGRRPAQLLSLVAAGISLLALIGYLLGFLALYSVPTQVPIALNTAVCFAVLCLGILCARLDREPMATIASATAGGIVARRLLPAAFAVPLVLSWLRIRSREMGLLSEQMGLSLFALGNIVAFNLLVWWNARMLYRMDERRREAEEQLQLKNQLLEETVRSERAAIRALEQAQSQLVQSEKLAGLGQMVAGVAHEINNPLAFVSNNLAVLQRDVAAIRELVILQQEVLGAAAALLEKDHADSLTNLRDHSERIDLTYTLGNLPNLTKSSREGLKRIQQIVKDLRNFARLDESDLHEVDLNEGIESTVNMTRSRAEEKGVRIELGLGPLPLVACHPAKMNQVVMNLVVNAIEASSAGGKVSVSTAQESAGIRIEVADEGCGIDPGIRDRIFDPFFTTKPIGQGTGLGLSISYGVVKEHGGSIEVESAVGRGARFVVHLPLVTPAT
jgi:signal transduction histidine kinase